MRLQERPNEIDSRSECGGPMSAKKDAGPGMGGNDVRREGEGQKRKAALGIPSAAFLFWP